MNRQDHSDTSVRACIVAAVLQHALRAPEPIALICGEEEISYGQLSRNVQHAAQTLRERGMAAGDRVILEASSTPAFVTAYLAVHFAGGIAIPIDPAMPASRRELIADRVDASIVLYAVDQRVLMDDPSRRFADETAFRLPEGNDVADVIFTSGTTGEPKGVVLTHNNLAAAAYQINSFVGTRAGDVEVLPLPLGHNFGLASLRSLLCAGATVVLVEGFAFPGRIYAALDEHRATSFRCVPAGLTMMLRFSPEMLSDFATRIRYVELGSAPMPENDKRKLISLLPSSRICMHYGLTEASRSVFIDFNADKGKLGSVGRPAHGVDVRIAGPHGEAIEPGEIGEIQIRGRHIMKEYWKAPQRTRDAFVGEWLRTGDAGHVDADGFLFLDGRNTEIINVGGRKVSPAEVEEALRRHPAVSDCACTGIADPAGISGDAVAAVVLSLEGRVLNKVELREHLRRYIEPYKLPVKWLFSGTIPRTSTGKIQRHLLREQLESGGADDDPLSNGPRTKIER